MCENFKLIEKLMLEPIQSINQSTITPTNHYANQSILYAIDVAVAVVDVMFLLLVALMLLLFLLLLCWCCLLITHFN